MSRPRIELGSQELASCAITARPPQHDTTSARHRAFDVFQGSCYTLATCLRTGLGLIICLGFSIERREVWRKKRKERIFGKGKCKLVANFGMTMVMSLPSFSLFLSLPLSHRMHLTHNIGTAFALPLIFRMVESPVYCLASLNILIKLHRHPVVSGMEALNFVLRKKGRREWKRKRWRKAIAGHQPEKSFQHYLFSITVPTRCTYVWVHFALLSRRKFFTVAAVAQNNKDIISRTCMDF